MANDDTVNQMAQKIIDDQTREIDDFTNWINDQGE